LAVIVKGARRSERYGINWHSALRIKKQVPEFAGIINKIRMLFATEAYNAILNIEIYK